MAWWPDNKHIIGTASRTICPKIWGSKSLQFKQLSPLKSYYVVVSNIFFLFSPLFGEDSQFDEHFFQMGWFNHQLGYHFHAFSRGRLVRLVGRCKCCWENLGNSASERDLFWGWCPPQFLDDSRSLYLKKRQGSLKHLPRPYRLLEIQNWFLGNIYGCFQQ